MKKMKKITLLYFAFAIALFGLSCKSDTPVEKPWTRSGNEITIRFPSEPGGLNPIINIGDSYSGQVNRHIFQFLHVLDPHTGKLAPMLAKALPMVQQVEEGPYAGTMSYTIEIREEAVWDDGEPVTAADVLFTYKSIFNPSVPAQRIRPYLNFIQNIEVDANNPKRFTVYSKIRYILSEEALVAAVPILPAHVFDPQGYMAGVTLSELLDAEKLKKLEGDERLRAFADQFTGERFNRDTMSVLGSGPYKLLRWEAGQRIVLQKKENWWGDQLAESEPVLQAFPDQITYQIVRDQTAAATLVKGEELDIGYALDVQDFIDIRDNVRMQEIYNFYTPATIQYNLIYINMRKPILRDVNVRKALAHLMDVEAVIENAFQGMAMRITGPIHPEKDHYNKALEPIQFSLDQAQALLTEAGWEDSNGNGTLDKIIDGKRAELKLDLLITSSQAAETVALLLKDQAAKVGFEIEPLVREFSSWREEMNARNYDLALGAMTNQPLLDDLAQLWHTDNDRPDGSNRTGFGTPETDELIETINQTLDKPQRDILYRRFQEVIYEEQPAIFLVSTQARVIVHKRFNSFASIVSPGYFPHMYALESD